MTIGELAKRVGLRTSAIRYYEQVGLLEPASRSHSGQRRYSVATVKRLRFIQTARSLGFSLAEIRELFEPGLVSEHWQRVAAEKIADLDALRERLVRISHCTCASVQECESNMVQIRRNANGYESKLSHAARILRSPC